jgi:hypothetical protein
VRATRCWQHGKQPEYAISGHRYWDNIRAQTAWSSPQRIAARVICRFCSESGERTVRIPLAAFSKRIPLATARLEDRVFLKEVTRLVQDSMYGIRIAYKAGNSHVTVRSIG